MSRELSPFDAGETQELFYEFQQLEELLPPALRRLALQLIDQVYLGASTPTYDARVNAATSAIPGVTERQSHWLREGAPLLRAPLNQRLARHTKEERQLHWLRKLSVLENGRELSPIPVPKPKFDPKIFSPAMNTKQLSTGVLWCTERATEYGFDPEDHEWANMGQGAPEHGDTIPGSFPRPKLIPIPDVSKEYAPTAGIKPLREAVAHYYNTAYRQSKKSKYTWKNVCIVPGGRAGLTRIASIISDCYLSFFLPDYTAYAEMLSLFKNFSPIPVPLNELDNYQMHLDLVKRELMRGVLAILTLNPRNPTGRAMSRDQLHQLHKICREKCLLIMDEFYTHYNYDDGCTGLLVSLAEMVDDVNHDPVLILDGLTKAFRLPGWRICWIVGPEEYIRNLLSSGSFLDGGSNAPFQYAAVDFLEPSLVRAEMKALQCHFKMKRDYIVQRLTKMGFPFDQGRNSTKTPNLTFYLWLNLAHLPQKLSNCLGFFHECLHEKVIVVPGFFFLINPQNLLRIDDIIWYNYVRISYGPEFDQVVKGMDGIERILHRFGCLPYAIGDHQIPHTFTGGKATSQPEEGAESAGSTQPLQNTQASAQHTTAISALASEPVSASQD